MIRVRASTALRFWACALAALLLAFLGAFFVEHVSEWFLSGEGLPPPQVWAAMAGHLVMLAGYLLLMFVPRAGSLALAAGVAVFLVAIWDADVLWIGAVALSPAPFAVASVALARRERSALPQAREQAEAREPR